MSDPGHYRIGIELNPEAARFARRVSGCPIFETPFEEFRSGRKFDVITMINVFSHVPSFDAMFASGELPSAQMASWFFAPARWLEASAVGTSRTGASPTTCTFSDCEPSIFFATNTASRLSGMCARRSRTSFSSLRAGAKWAATRRQSPEASRFASPGSLPAMKRAYAAALGKRLFVSFIVLKPITRGATSDEGRDRNSGETGDAAARIDAPRVAGRAARSPFLLRTIRCRPRLYSAICRARLFYSRESPARRPQWFRRHQTLFA